MRQELPGVAIADTSAPLSPAGGGHISDRFLGRVNVYDKARPGYPAALLRWIAEMVPAGAHVAEIGAGTGLFTEPLLRLDLTLTAVEPNAEMRTVLAERLGAAVEDGRLTVADGSAERTGLADQSADMVAAAQAAHWFTPRDARIEFARVLRPRGRVLLVWNDWREVENPFNRAYGGVVRTFLTPGNENVETRVPDERIPELLPLHRERRVFSNPVTMSRERLRMLAQSASYLPGPGHPAAGCLQDALDAIFDRHARHDNVTLEYRTVAYLGR